MRVELRPAYPIRTARLALRPYVESDVEAVLDLNSRPDVVRYIPSGVLDRDGAVALVERRLGEIAITAECNRILVAATIPPDDRVIGEFMLKVLSEPPAAAGGPAGDLRSSRRSSSPASGGRAGP